MLSQSDHFFLISAFLWPKTMFLISCIRGQTRGIPGTQNVMQLVSVTFALSALQKHETKIGAMTYPICYLLKQSNYVRLVLKISKWMRKESSIKQHHRDVNVIWALAATGGLCGFGVRESYFRSRFGSRGVIFKYSLLSHFLVTNVSVRRTIIKKKMNSLM